MPRGAAGRRPSGPGRRLAAPALASVAVGALALLREEFLELLAPALAIAMKRASSFTCGSISSKLADRVPADALPACARGAAPSRWQAEHAARAHQRGIQRLALDQRDAEFAQPEPVLHVAPPARRWRDAGKCSRTPDRRPSGSPDVVDREHQHRAPSAPAVRSRSRRATRRRRTGPASQSGAGPRSARRRGRGPSGDAVGVEHAAHDLSVAAEAGDDHRRRLRLADLGQGSRRVPRARRRIHQRSAATSSSGVSSIGSRPWRRAARPARLDHAGAGRRLEDDEAELPAWAKQDHEHQPLRRRQRHQRPSRRARAPSRRGTRQQGHDQARCSTTAKSRVMPTAMKNRPSSGP